MELKHKEKEALWQTFFEQHAYLKETGGWHLSLERLLGEALTPVAFPPKESWQELTKDGLPLLQHEDLLPCVAAAAAGRLDGALSLVLGSQDIETPEEMHQSLTDLRAFAANQEAATALFTALLQQDDAAIRHLAAEHGLQETSLRLFGWAVIDALVPAEAKDAAVWEEAGWTRNYCPVCGRQPVMAVLRKEQHGRARFLVCDGCHTVWPYARVGCVYCGNQDLKKMKILEPEGEEAMRLDVCEECHAYLKTYQGCKQINQAAPDGPDECEEIYRHDWATLHLDLAGQEQGLVKRGSALLAAAPGPDEGEEK